MINSKWFLFLSLVLLLILVPQQSVKASLAQDLSGRILLSVEQNGEAWYMYPLNLKRYYLGRPDDAFRIMRELGLGISEKDFQNLEVKRLAGRIVLQVEKNGEAWYINPLNLKKYYLGRPTDAFNIMRQLGLGIRVNDLLQIPRALSSGTISTYNSYRRQTVTTSSGSFTVDVVTIDLANPNLKIRTLTAALEDCDFDCPVKSLVDYYEAGRGFAAINGTYFNTGVTRKNYSFYPVYNSLADIFINANQLIFPTTGPIIALASGNQFHYFSSTRDFGSVVSFENRFGDLSAALGNKPSLIENSINVLIDSDLDEKQRTTKSLRNALGFADNKLFLIVARNATVTDLAKITLALEMQYAMNLDGGGSSALIYDDEYKIGPGRNIINALVFSEE